MAHFQSIQVKILCLFFVALLPCLAVGQTGTQPRQIEAVDTQSTGVSLPSYEDWIMVSELDTIGIDDYRYHHNRLAIPHLFMKDDSICYLLYDGGDTSCVATDTIIDSGIDTLFTIIYGSGDSTFVIQQGDTVWITYPEPGMGGDPGDTLYYWILQVNSTGNDTIVMGEIVNLVAGTNISISQGATNVTINATDTETDIDSAAIIGTVLHIYEDDKDRTVELSGLLDSVGHQSMIVVNAVGSDTLFLTYRDGTRKDTVVFYPPEQNDTYLDSIGLLNAGDSIPFYIRDTSGIIDTLWALVPSDSIDTDSQSLTYVVNGQFDTIGITRGNQIYLFDQDSQSLALASNILSITRGNSVDLTPYLDNDTIYQSLSISTDGPIDTIFLSDDGYVILHDLNDTVYQSFSIDTTTGLFILSDDPTASPDLLVLPWKDSDADDYSANYTDSIRHNGYVGINRKAGYALDVQSSDAFNEAIARFIKGSGGAAVIRISKQDSTQFDLMNWGSSFDIRRAYPNSGGSTDQFMRLDTTTTGRIQHYIWHDDEGFFWATDYGQGYHIPTDPEDDTWSYLLAPREDGRFLEIPLATLIDSLTTIQAGIGSQDYDFIKLQGDTLYAGELIDTLLPNDSTDLLGLIYHRGRVRLGNPNYYPSIYWNGTFYENFVLDQDSIDTGTGLQIYGKRSAIDIYHATRPYIHVRNSLGEFYHRVYDPSGEVGVDPQEYQIGTVGKYYDSQSETYDTTDRAIFTIGDDSDARSLTIFKNYLQSDIYRVQDRDDTLRTDSLYQLLTTDTYGNFKLVKMDTVALKLGVIAAASPEIDTFFLNDNDSLGLDLTNTVNPIQYVDLSKFNVTISNDSIFQGGVGTPLPQGADSLGTAFPDTRVVVSDGTRGGTSYSEFTATSSQVVTPAGLRVGLNRAADGASNLDLISVAGQPFSTRLFRASGANGGFNFQNSGTGNINLLVDGANLGFVLRGTDRSISYPAYTSTSSFTGTSIGLIGFDASGNMLTETFDNIEVDMGGPFQPAGSYMEDFNVFCFGCSGDPGFVVTDGDNWYFNEGAGITMTAGSIPSTGITIAANVTAYQTISQTPARSATSYPFTLSNSGGTITLPVFSSLLAGLVPAPNPAGSTRFLREDGSWITPSNATITLTGPVTGSGTSTIATTIGSGVIGSTELASVGIGAGSCNNCTITVDADGRVTNYSTGSGGSTDIYTASGTITNGATRNVTLGTAGSTALNFLDDSGSNILNMNSSSGGSLTINVDPSIGASGSDQLQINTTTSDVRLKHEAASSASFLQFTDGSEVNLRSNVNLNMSANATTGTASVTGGSVNMTAGSGSIVVNSSDIVLNSTGITTIQDNTDVGSSGSARGRIYSSGTSTRFQHSTEAAAGGKVSGLRLDNTGGWFLGTNATGSETGYIQAVNGLTITAVTATNPITMTGKIGLNIAANTTHDIRIGSNDAAKGTAGAWLATSDARLKKNIEQLDGKTALNQLLGLRGVNYEWNEESKSMGFQRREGKQWGLIAQDIVKVFGEDPNFVSMDDGYYMAAYSNYDPLFIESFRYVKDQLEQKDAQISVLQKQILKLTERINKLDGR